MKLDFPGSSLKRFYLWWDDSSTVGRTIRCETCAGLERRVTESPAAGCIAIFPARIILVKSWNGSAGPWRPGLYPGLPSPCGLSPTWHRAHGHTTSGIMKSSTSIQVDVKPSFQACGDTYKSRYNVPPVATMITYGKNLWINEMAF